jgi:hypothetical protein
LDTFLSELAGRLLQVDGSTIEATGMSELRHLLETTPETIQKAQQRIYAHPKTAEFAKRWNLPIYYQLRFGDSCTRLNTAIERTQREGWHAEAFSGTGSDLERLRKETGFELALFIELYDIISDFWTPTVFLRPLSHRFLRGAVQLLCRTVSFVRDGLEGKIKFGEEKRPVVHVPDENGTEANGDILDSKIEKLSNIRDPYCWGDSLEDVASVSWELTILESKLTHDYREKACGAVVTKDTPDSEKSEITGLVKEVLAEVADQIGPVVQQSWNGVIVEILTKRCCAPLAAVKGVAATYRMTNRPPPTQASPFVGTILRALKEFDTEFKLRTPPQVGVRWKTSVVETVAQRYSSAVEELLATVQRTEAALRNRNVRRALSGGMSDGQKAKLQLYLDYKDFSEHVRQVGIDPSTIEGVQKLKSLTIDAESFGKTNGTN